MKLSDKHLIETIFQIFGKNNNFSERGFFTRFRMETISTEILNWEEN